MPPTSPKQARYIFAQARRGTPWAKKYIGEASTMKPKRSYLKRNG